MTVNFARNTRTWTSPDTETVSGVTDQANFKDVCKAIDLIATTRARAIQCGYRAKSIAHPSANDDAPLEERKAHLQELLGQRNGFDRANRLLHGEDPDGEINAAVCGWVATIALQEGKLTDRMPVAKSITNDLCLAAEAFIDGDCVDTVSFDQAIFAHFSQMSGFFEEVTTFINMCWFEFEAARNTQIDQAIEARKLIDTTLVRLEKIGKHVRLVSLNASVEASRAGDAGRGLAVIATEFKSLAEEIQGLASSARNNIDQLIK